MNYEEQVTSAITSSPSVFMADLQQRLLKRVRRLMTGCWIWTGSTKPNGYGNINVAGKTLMTHRAAWLAFKGEIPNGMQVCHHCDTPACVNPDHLFLGSQKDNMDDMDAKGRRVVPNNAGSSNPMFGRQHTSETKAKQSAAKEGQFVGSKHPKATINEQTARAILDCKGRMTARAAAENLGVSWHVVRNIWSGKSWGFING